MEQRNEPTTAEIVKALRNCYGTPCETCVMRIGKEEFLCSAKHLADRLEQLERDLEAFKAFHERYAEQTSKKYVHDICALTDRAEKAEAERDDVVNCANGICGLCKHKEVEYDQEPCFSCAQSENDEHPNWMWRGPRGKENA